MSEAKLCIVIRPLHSIDKSVKVSMKKKQLSGYGTENQDYGASY